jgi:hypothetical protein
MYLCWPAAVSTWTALLPYVAITVNASPHSGWTDSVTVAA